MSCLRFAAAGLGLLVLASLAGAQVIRVPAQQPTIQDALLRVGPGATILVERGTYLENLFWPRTDGIRVIAVEGPERTVIDGGGRGRVVQFPPGLTRATLLEGFTITHGREQEGAGVRILSSPTLRRNHIVDNQAVTGTFNRGGGVHVSGGGAPLLERNRIRRNVVFGTGAEGGGVYITGGAAPELIGNDIRDNVCVGALLAEGAGILVDAFPATRGRAVANVIARNQCAFALTARGGGVSVRGGPLAFVNNTVVSNGVSGVSDARGGGLYFDRAAPRGSVVVNNIVARNAGAGLQVDGGAPFLDYNDVWRNVPADYRGTAPGRNDVSKDPAFAGPDDFHLASTSPLIDAGTNHPVAAAAGLDVDGDPRFLDGDLGGPATGGARADIGADELAPAGLVVQGSPFGGAQLLFSVSGPAGANFTLVWSPDAQNRLIQPFGQLLVGPRLALLGVGKVPGRVGTGIPAQPLLTGMRVQAQALVTRPAGSGLTGAFTRRVEAVILEPARFVRETFTTTLMRDPNGTTADWTRGGKPGLYAVFGYGGDGSDGDLVLKAGAKKVLDSSTRKPGADGVVVWNFRVVNIAATARLELKGVYPIRIRVQGSCVLAGTVDASGKNGLSAPAGKASVVGRIPGGAGGPGGGAGGASNTNLTSPWGALPMELRGGPGYPRAQRCGQPNRSDNRLITVIEPNCGGGTGGNRGLPSGSLLRDGCSGNGGGHFTSGLQTDCRCANVGAFGREFGVNWIVPTGAKQVVTATSGTGGGAGGNAAITTGSPSPKDDIVAGSGGGAGGGVELQCYETLTVKSSATVLARGGSGGAGHATVVGGTTIRGGWGAGGAGGSLWLSGTSVVVEAGATLDARGGKGNPSPPSPQRGGAGGNGYIIVRDRGGNPAVNSTSVFPPPVGGRSLFDPAPGGVSQAVSLFYDAGVTNPRWSFDASDPRTGEVVPGLGMQFKSPPAPGQKLFLFFQGAPDLNGKPNPDPRTRVPPGDAFTADIARLRDHGGLRHLRFKIVIHAGKRQKGKPSQNPIVIESLAIQY